MRQINNDSRLVNVIIPGSYGHTVRKELTVPFEDLSRLPDNALVTVKQQVGPYDSEKRQIQVSELQTGNELVVLYPSSAQYTPPQEDIYKVTVRTTIS